MTTRGRQSCGWSPHRTGEAGRISSSLVTAVSVAAIVLAIAFFVVDRPGDGADSAADAANPPASTSSAEQQTEQQVGGTAKQGAEPTSDRAAKKADKKAKPRPSTQPTSDAVPDVYVEVYNNSAISGLAATRSAQLRDAGWQVVGVDNWRGAIPASTVYYPSGMAVQADRLAKELGISRTHTAVAPMKFDRLTVILTADAG